MIFQDPYSALNPRHTVGTIVGASFRIQGVDPPGGVRPAVQQLLEDLQDELDLTYLLIVHDLSVVRHVSDRVAVMYLGKIVEFGDRNAVYTRPLHPYTVAMLSAVPVPDPKRRSGSQRILLTGDVPSPLNPPPACRFHTRCWKAQDICRTQEPPLAELSPATASPATSQRTRQYTDNGLDGQRSIRIV